MLEELIDGWNRPLRVEPRTQRSGASLFESTWWLRCVWTGPTLFLGASPWGVLFAGPHPFLSENNHRLFEASFDLLVSDMRMGFCFKDFFENSQRRVDTGFMLMFLANAGLQDVRFLLLRWFFWENAALIRYQLFHTTAPAVLL